MERLSYGKQWGCARGPYRILTDQEPLETRIDFSDVISNNIRVADLPESFFLEHLRPIQHYGHGFGGFLLDQYRQQEAAVLAHPEAGVAS